MKNVLLKAFQGIELDKKDIEKIISGINNSTIENEQVAALLGALSTKQGGITPQELYYFSDCVKKFSKKLNLYHKNGLIDVCGSGGDCLNTFNISTAVSFVVASFDIGVAKHGARAISSKSGSVDVLSELRINPVNNEEILQKSLDKTNLTFLNASYFNATMAKIKLIRNKINFPTIFNLLGPLINPATLDYQVIGVFDENKCEVIVNSLKETKIKSAMVVHSLDGLDELSITDKNTIFHFDNGIVKKIELPELSNLGLSSATIEDIKGGDAKTNAKIIIDILNGKKGPKRDIVVLNAAAALVCAKIAKDFKEGVEKAKNAIDSKSALKVLEGVRQCF